MNLKQIVREQMLQRKRRSKPKQPWEQTIQPRQAHKNKCLIGTYLEQDEWNYLGFRSSCGWMDPPKKLEKEDWLPPLTPEEKLQIEKERSETVQRETEINYKELVTELKKTQKPKGRPQKKVVLTTSDDQTGYGMLLNEFEEKYPVNKYYWDDDDGDPREVAWGGEKEIEALVNKLVL